MLFIHPLAQSFSRLEMRAVFGGNQYLAACLGIAPVTGWSISEFEAAEVAEFDALTASQGIGYLVQHQFDRKVDIFQGQLRMSVGKSCDEFCAGHG